MDATDADVRASSIPGLFSVIVPSYLRATFVFHRYEDDQFCEDFAESNRGSIFAGNDRSTNISHENNESCAPVGAALRKARDIGVV